MPGREGLPRYTRAMPCKTVHQFWRSPALPFVESRRASDSAACYLPHAHPTLSLGTVDGGQSLFTHNGRQQSLVRGDVHSCNPVNDGFWSYQMLYLDTDWVSGVVGEMGALDAVLLSRLPKAVAPHRIHERLARLNACLFSRVADEDKEAALLLFVGDLFAPPAVRQALERANGEAVETPLQQRLAGVQRMIAERCCETLSLEVLAHEAGMSRYQLVRAFGRFAGMTPHAWQLDQRIQRARGLLDRGTPLADVAQMLGFADQSHFQRAFKARVAVTPGEYRRARRNFLQD